MNKVWNTSDQSHRLLPRGISTLIVLAILTIWCVSGCDREPRVGKTGEPKPSPSPQRGTHAAPEIGLVGKTGKPKPSPSSPSQES